MTDLSVAQPAPTVADRVPSAVWVLALWALVALLFVTGAPTDGAFSWPDSPRHSLNGAFVLDLLRTLPFDDPMGYAFDYYSQYPALTIGLYPPLFYFQLAGFYALFGVSQWSAVLALFASYCVFAAGAFALARQYMGPALAFGIAAILVCLPELTYWGRQVMLEMPAYALTVWSGFAFVRFLRAERMPWLYLAAALLVLAIYTKISLVFLAPAYALILFLKQGFALLRDRHSYIISALAVIGLVPLVLMTLKFGQTNLVSTVGISDRVVERWSLAGWAWYAEQIPDQLGWPAFLAVVLALAVALLRADWRRLLVTDHGLWLAWFVIGYIFFSLIDLKEARHSVFILLPLILLIGMVAQEAERWRPRIGLALVALIALATLATTAITRPVHYVAGYLPVVDYVAEAVPASSNVMFSGYRDGAFIFNMRAAADRPDVSVIRADKLLLRIAVRRTLGVEQQSYTEAEITDQIGRLGIHYVVAQPDFWTDLEQMARLQSVLEGPGFEEVARFAMPANYPAQEKELVVYRNLGEVAEGPINIINELPAIGGAISGSISTDEPAP